MFYHYFKISLFIFFIILFTSASSYANAFDVKIKDVLVKSGGYVSLDSSRAIVLNLEEGKDNSISFKGVVKNDVGANIYNSSGVLTAYIVNSVGFESILDVKNVSYTSWLGKEAEIKFDIKITDNTFYSSGKIFLEYMPSGSTGKFTSENMSIKLYKLPIQLPSTPSGSFGQTENDLKLLEESRINISNSHLKESFINDETGKEHRTYHRGMGYYEIKGGWFSGYKEMKKHQRVCLAKDVLDVCEVDLNRTSSSSTRHGETFGKAGPGYGIVLKKINTNGNRGEAYYSLEGFNNGDVCLDSVISVSSRNNSRGWYQHESEIYLTCQPPAQRDTDNDGTVDAIDNCNGLSNPDQADTDGDNFGDACDKCPTVSGDGRYDLDGDGIGNECDDDRDGDMIPNTIDVCPDIPMTPVYDDWGRFIRHDCGYPTN